MMRDFMTVAKALSDETRVRILMALTRGELCVCQIAEFLGLAPSTISKHLQVLHMARLVNARKDGRWVYYSLARSGAPAEVRGAVTWMKASLKGNMTVKKDLKALERILKEDPANLCKK